MHYADYRTILSPKNGMNLYRGCTHGCIYCDSRSACYQINQFQEKCQKHGMLYRLDDVFGYMREFNAQERQLSLFE